jgi:hypothetical protein
VTRAVGKQDREAKVQRQGRALNSGERLQPRAAGLPSAPGPGATAEEWRAWGEAMYKAGKLGFHTSRDG